MEKIFRNLESLRQRNLFDKLEYQFMIIVWLI